VGIEVLAGTEADILPDGSIDFPLDTLRGLDVVIASIHARHGQDSDAMTDRLVNCMRQPIRKIWGHPLGRLLLLRDPIECRLGEILEEAAAHHAVVEINGDPRRLDLPPAAAILARQRGLSFVVSADAHSGRGLLAYRFGVAMARRAGLRRRHVLNTLDARSFSEAVRPVSHP
jgi:DNA polymerase (family 10)